MSAPFDVQEFVQNNKNLVKKYLRKNTDDVFVPDFVVDEKYYYQKSPKLLNDKVERPEYTQLQKLEYIKCARQCNYFCRKYIKITSVDEGIVPFDMYKYQDELIDKAQNNRFLITLQCRQSGKTSTFSAYVLWFNTFHSSKVTAILANKAKQAQSILSRVRLAYELLPNFLKQSVTVYNKQSIEFSNNSHIFSAASSSDSIRGESVSLLYIDECAFLKNDMEFYESTYPTISSGKNTQVLISSTPNGSRGLFYKLWKESEEGLNDFVNHVVTWDMVPGRDQKWKEEQIRNTSREQFEQEHECKFRGSTNSLISGYVLASLPAMDPIEIKDETLKIYYYPEEGRQYFTVVDVSKGLGGDFSAFIVYDVTELPYKVCAVYKSNVIDPLVYPSIIHNTCMFYNESLVMVELNNNGVEVANALFHDFEYENMIMTVKDKTKQVIGFGGNKAKHGVETTTPVKSIGCSTVKSMIENGQLELNDINVIDEFGTFVPKGKSYEADQGAHDDLAMCCVLFAWATTNHMFKELTNTDLQQVLNSRYKESELMPFGYIERGDGTEDHEVFGIDNDNPFRVQEGVVDYSDPFFEGF